MKTTQITITAAGRNNFHNSQDIILHIRPEQYDPIKGDTIYLTASQERRIVKNYCGMVDCECGSSPENMEYIGPKEAILHV